MTIRQKTYDKLSTLFIMETKGLRIKYIREDIFGLGQKEFALKIGVDQTTLSNWELGKRNPKGQQIDKICQISGVSKNWLETGQGEIFDKDAKKLIPINNLVLDKKTTEDLWKDKVIILQQKIIDLQEQIDHLRNGGK